jgi:hypothetical protein
MLNNHIQEIRECYQQATHCVQQAEAHMVNIVMVKATSE